MLCVFCPDSRTNASAAQVQGCLAHTKTAPPPKTTIGAWSYSYCRVLGGLIPYERGIPASGALIWCTQSHAEQRRRRTYLNEIVSRASPEAADAIVRACVLPRVESCRTIEFVIWSALLSLVKTGTRLVCTELPPNKSSFDVAPFVLN